MKHHPDAALLLDYAGGAADPALALIVATHLVFCAQCRRAVAAGESVGGALLENMPPAALPGDALTKTLTRLENAPPLSPARAPSKDGTPLPLRDWLGGDLGDVRWRKMGPRLAYAPLWKRGGAVLRLLRGAAGADVGRHGHRGQEYTLVLAGGFTDETGSYGPGDFQMTTPDVTHNPIADAGQDCINLALTTAPLAFDGLIPKIAGKLFGF